MSIVRVLVVAHLGLTAALLLVFAAVVLCQWLIASARPAAATTPLLTPYPSDGRTAEPVVVPAQEAVPRRTPTDAAASVLEWTIDLRSAARETVRAGAAPTSS